MWCHKALRLGNVITISATKKRFYCVGTFQNVYKKIGYEAPFSDQETSEVLKVINEATSASDLAPFINKTRAENIIKLKDAVGQFQVIEQLLDVKKIEPSILEIMCRKVLTKQDVKIEIKKVAVKKIDFLNYMKPTITSNVTVILDSFYEFRAITTEI
jgi:hypothetical protein